MSSLAATLAADGMRPASFLPAIKCSNCGQEIEIASMGDHLCGKADPSPKMQHASLSNPFTLRQMNTNGQHASHIPSPLQQQSQPVTLPKTRIRAPTVTSNQLAAPRPIRTAPPRINPDAANKPFLAPRPPRSDSPMSPALSVRSGSSNNSRPQIARSMTSPMPRMFDFRPPSPELTGNADCAFPPFPTPSTAGSGSRPGTSNGRKTSTPSERAPSRGRPGQEARLAVETESFNFAPKSPLGNPSEPARGRSSTMRSGPWDASGQGISPQPLAPLDRRRPSLSSIKLSHEPPPIPTEPLPRPSTSHSDTQTPSATTPGPNDVPSGRQQIQKNAPTRPERPAEDVLSPRFLDQMTAEPIIEMPSTFSPSQPPVPMRSADRSRTFPVRQESSDEPSPSQALQRTPSEPPGRGRGHRPSMTATSISEPSRIPQTQARARSQSRSGPRMDHRLQDAPPVPMPVHQHNQERMHSPSQSGSSTASSAQSVGNSNSTSGPSPVGSAASSVDAFSALTQAKYGEDERMRVAGLNLKAQQKPGMRAEQPAQRSPPFARPSPPQQLVLPVERVPTIPAALSPPLESPMDPAMQSGRAAPMGLEPIGPPPALQSRPSLPRTNTTPEPRQRQPALADVSAIPALGVPAGKDAYDPYRAPSPQPALRTRSNSNAAAQNKAYNTGSSMRPLSPQPVPPPPIPQEVPRAQPPTRRGTSVKPKCRGCGLLIEGKSVKAADGRLTGRWHKACFTCKACEQPFTTADFYVINNQPYCEQHYHEQNGSLCHGCTRGIEGHYLETISSSAAGSGEKKFHPRCFTCHDCRQVLSDDYFEINSRVYCERHALAAMRGQARMAGPGLNPPDRKALTAERRTTKLMMM
ncbi:hypothetical protein LTR36_001666 [Oleoguttula mirabilis]|uniref:LIM zinc-binding domain-containing protein n=1 Tax=Oleoguttula mirabilis TaxID=1507867 RepID=A0AAV9JNJ1_9PEZI|nr:hypothetical protein LTR36_001666 [Oleoguttula mirabilis]